MKNILPLIKGYKRAAQSLCLILIFISFNGLAQSPATPQVSITVNILPPYSPYYADYSGSNASKVLLIVRNLTSTQKRIKLTGELNGDNGIRISTKSNYVPLQPIILQPNETKQLNGTALKDVFDLNSLNVYGIDKVKLVQTSRIPEGNYSFCLQAVDMNTNQVITNTAPLGCTSFSIAYPEAPILINPTTDGFVKPTPVPSFNFTWMNAGIVPITTQYTLQVAEMPLAAVDPNQVLNAVSFPLLNKKINATSYPYAPSDPILKVGQRYAWRVQAVDLTGKVAFRNDGKSAAAIFTYDEMSAPKIGAPKTANTDDFKLFLMNPSQPNSQITVTTQSPLNFSWLLTKQSEIDKIKAYNDALLKAANEQIPSGYSQMPKELRDKFEAAKANYIRQYQKNLGVDTNLYKTIGIKKYVVVVVKKSPIKNGASTVIFSESLNEMKGGVAIASNVKGVDDKFTDKENTNYIKNNFLKSKTEALKLGLVDKENYILEVQGRDHNDKIIKRTGAMPFTFNIGQDIEEKFIVRVKTKLRYTFEGKAGDYAVANTPVTVKVRSTGAKGDYKGYFQPIEVSAETDVEGNLTLDVPIKKLYSAYMFEASMTINSAYYGSKNLKKIPISKPTTDINEVNLGTQFSNVYAYGLKLYVQKEFPTFKVENQGKSYLTANNEQSEFDYDEKGNLVYNVKTKEYEAGVNIRLYRKGKQSYIPPAEGTIQKLGLIAKEKDVLIAQGKTQLETVNGETKSFVKFEKLLCNLYDGDEYYVLATGATNVNRLGIGEGSKYYIRERSEQEFGDGYTATEKLIKFIPKEDIAYSEFVDTYTILSNKPPQSVVSGRIVYQWKQNKDMIKRAYANQSFQIRVGYRFRNSNGTYEYLAPDLKEDSGEENFFVKETAGTKTELVLLRDQGMIAGSGTTDATGRFTIQIDNLGYKGDLGAGAVYRSNDPLKEWQKNQEQQPTKSSPGAILADIEALRNDPYGEMNLANLRDAATLPTEGYEAASHANSQYGATFNPQFEQTEIAGASGRFSVGVRVNVNRGASLRKRNNNIIRYASNGIEQIKLGERLVSETAPTEATNVTHLNRDEPLETPENNSTVVGIENIKSSESSEPEVENGTKSKKEDKTGTLERVFIVEPINYHLYPCEEPLIVQPFGAKDGGDFVAPVWETRLILKAQDTKGNPLSNLKVIFFRTKEQKFPGMPLGEGDNKYKSGKLVNPQIFNVNNALMGGGSEHALAQNGIYNQEFEKLWEGVTGLTGTFTMPQLLAGTDYYMQVTSQPDKSTITYNAIIQYVDRMAEGDQNLTVTLYPLPSRIAGRVVEDGTSQRPINQAYVTISNNNNYKYLTYTDKEGYFEILTNAKNVPALPIVKLKINKNGYADDHNDILIDKSYGQQYYKTLTLKLGALAKGWVADANANKVVGANKYRLGVDAYVRRKSNGAMVTTSDDPNKRGYYEIGVPSVQPGQSLEQLEIIPIDVAYFKEDNVTANEKSVAQVSTLDKRRYDLVYRRSHREKFVIIDQNTQQPIPNMTVQIDDKKAISDVNGIASFDFENVSINNYKVIFTDDKTQEYIPKIFQLESKEGRTASIHNIVMKKGNIIKGTVTLDGKLVAGAKIYLEFQLQNSGYLTSASTLIETRSLADGSYTLKGIPIDPSLVNIIATLDADYTVIGDKKPGNQPNLTLTSFKQGIVKSLHGFPLTVEEMKPAGGDLYKVTGIVDLSKGSTPFKMNQKDAIVRVRNVVYKLTNGLLLPVEDNTPIEGVSNITFRYLDKYNVLLSAKANSTSQLIITRTRGIGEISGTAKIVDNSFNYPSTYLNFNSGEDFYLADKVDETTINNKISAIRSLSTDVGFLTNIKNATYPIVPKAFNISNVNGQAINFQFIEVNANANPLNTYIATDGKIHLNVNLAYKNVPNINPSSFTVELKDVVLNNEKIEPGTGAPIILKLEDWTLKVDNWRFDPVKGGIYSESALLQTAKLDIPIKLFNLRKDMMVFDKIDATGLKLGGGAANIEVVSPKNAILIYDTQTGSDMSPHWRMSIAGNGNEPAAIIKNLKNVGDLKVSYLQVLSNNESILSLANDNPVIKLANNSTAQFTAQTVTNNTDFFDLEGSLDLKAPRMAPFPLSLRYSNNGSLSYNNVTTEFEGKGYVHFIADNQKIDITQSKVTIAGSVQEKPSATFETIPATFIAEGSGYKVNLPTNHLLNLSADGSQRFSITSGGMKVENNDWSILSFSGNLISNAEGLKEKPTPMTFNVYGDVQVNGDGINAGTETAFGTFKMVYDFKKSTLLGSLNFPETDFGAYSIAGNLEMMIGAQGFYLLGSGKLNTAIPVVGGGYTVGFLISNYKDGNDAITPQMWNTLQAFQLNKNNCFFETHKSDFKGFYLTAGRSLIDFQKEFDFVIVAGYIEAKAAAELSIWSTFGGNTSVGASIGATGRLRAGMSAITGTSLSGGFEATAAVVMKYESGTFSLGANAEASFTAHVSQNLLVTSVSLDKAVAARLHFGTDGYSLEFSSGDKLPACPPKN